MVDLQLIYPLTMVIYPLTNGIYPLVNVDITMENHIFCMGKLTINGNFQQLCEARTNTHQDIVSLYGIPTLLGDFVGENGQVNMIYVENMGSINVNRRLINHGLSLRGYSSNSYDLILQCYSYLLNSIAAWGMQIINQYKSWVRLWWSRGGNRHNR